MLCLGGNAALFSVVHSVLLRLLPVPLQDRILQMNNQYSSKELPREQDTVEAPVPSARCSVSSPRPIEPDTSVLLDTIASDARSAGCVAVRFGPYP